MSDQTQEETKQAADETAVEEQPEAQSQEEEVQPQAETDGHADALDEGEEYEEYEEYEEEGLIQSTLKSVMSNPENVNGAKLGGDVLVLPGVSLMLDGKLKPGALHAGAGLLAKAAFGLPGLALVAANSYSMSRTGRGLWSNLVGPKGAPDVNLKEEVAKDVAAGLTLEEINARVSEDVADMYEEAKAADPSDQAGQS